MISHLRYFLDLAVFCNVISWPYCIQIANSCLAWDGLRVSENLTICWQLTIISETHYHHAEGWYQFHNNSALLRQTHDITSKIFSGPSTILQCVTLWVSLQYDNQIITLMTIYNAFLEFISPDMTLHNLLMAGMMCRPHKLSMIRLCNNKCDPY